MSTLITPRLKLKLIRLKATTDLSNRAIGERFGMSKAHVRRIVNGIARRTA